MSQDIVSYDLLFDNSFSSRFYLHFLLLQPLALLLMIISHPWFLPYKVPFSIVPPSLTCASHLLTHYSLVPFYSTGVLAPFFLNDSHFHFILCGCILIHEQRHNSSLQNVDRCHVLMLKYFMLQILNKSVLNKFKSFSSSQLSQYYES